MTQEPTLKVPTSTSSARQVNQATVVQQAVVQENQDDTNIHQFQNSLKSQQRLKELEAEVQHYESLVRELKKQMSISGMIFKDFKLILLISLLANQQQVKNHSKMVTWNNFKQRLLVANK